MTHRDFWYLGVKYTELSKKQFIIFSAAACILGYIHIPLVIDYVNY